MFRIISILRTPANPKDQIFVEEGFSQPEIREISEVSCRRSRPPKRLSHPPLCFPAELKDEVAKLYHGGIRRGAETRDRLFSPFTSGFFSLNLCVSASLRLYLYCFPGFAAQRLAVVAPEKSELTSEIANSIAENLSGKLRVLDSSMAETAFRSSDRNSFQSDYRRRSEAADAMDCDFSFGKHRTRCVGARFPEEGISNRS